MSALRRVVESAGAALVIAALAPPLAAESLLSPAPERVADILTSPRAGYAPRLAFGGVEIAGEFFYVATDETHGAELWKTDGTAAGTMLVKDIAPGSWSSDPYELTDIDGTLYFSADDGTHGHELWRSDGTEDGTVLVADIAPGPRSSAPQAFTRVGSTVFFTAVEPVHGGELWKSDGTSAGTVLVEDITPGRLGSVPTQLTAAGDLLFFVAHRPATGEEVWRSDGTTAGTFLLRDIFPGAWSSVPDHLTAFGGRLYWSAWEGSRPGLWTSDGTLVGTRLVRRMTIEGMVAVGDTLYLSADGQDGAGTEPWKSDGTSAGTVRIADLAPGDMSSEPYDLTPWNGLVSFVAFDGTFDFRLWRSDGTVAGTFPIGSPSAFSSPMYLAAVGGTLFFRAYDATTGAELWKSDGTESGTVLVSDLRPGSESSQPFPVGRLGSQLVLVADDGASGQELWTSDGTDAGTTMIVDHESWSASPAQLTRVGDRLFFTADDGVHGRELWTSDGTEAGTALVADIRAGDGSTSIVEPTSAGGLLFFVAPDGVGGYHVWRSDGTETGTFTVTDALDQERRAALWDLVDLNGVLLFRDAQSGLWRTDGTAAGTSLVKQSTCAPGTMPDARPQGSVAVGAFVYFAGCDSTHGVELWKSDGTEAGTVLVRDILPGARHSYPSYLVNVGGTLYFTAFDPRHGDELWKSDGTARGTILVKDVAPGTYGSSPRSLTNVDGALFFVAGAAQGAGLWRSGGTAATTIRLTDMPPGPTYCYCAAEFEMTSLNGRLFFAKDDGIHGQELWTSDGTQAGTSLLVDLVPGEAGSSPSALTQVGGLVFFQASDAESGTEAWATDGTPEGTFRVTDINPGPDSAFESDPPQLWDPWPRPSSFTVAGPYLFFAANDGSTGYELWSVPAATPSIPSQTVGGVGPAWATLHATLNPNGSAATAHFEYGATTSYGNVTPSEDLGPGTLPLALSSALVGLDCDTVYHFRAVVTNGAWALTGQDQTFRTVACSTFQLSAAAYVVAETGPRAIIAVTRTRGLAAGVTVDYATGGGTATADVDYAPVSGTLTFVAGETRRTFSVPIVNDTLDEENETVGLALVGAGPGALLGPRAAATLTIADNDAAGAVQFGALTYAASEGSGSVTIRVLRSGGAASGVTVQYATGGGTATAGDDYAPAAGVLSFAAGEMSKTFTVTINDDLLGENDETVGLTLSSPTGRAILGPRSNATLTIQENERIVQFASATFTRSEAAAAATITVKRSGLMTGTVTVHYATADGSASSGSDYLPQSGDLTFGPGVVLRSFAVPIVRDTLDEGDETVLVQLSSLGNVALGPTAAAVLTIVDDDASALLR